MTLPPAKRLAPADGADVHEPVCLHRVALAEDGRQRARDLRAAEERVTSVLKRGNYL
jgi:hypothetical protein